MASPSGQTREPNPGDPGLDHLPTALIATIMTKLDVPSILSLASTCMTFRSCAAHILSFLPNFHLLDIAPSMDLLRPLLPPDNPYLRSLKVDCTRLDDSSLDFLLRPSLQELCLRNCADFSGKLLSQLGHSCKDLRFLYLSSVAEKRGRSVDVLHLEELLSGCIHLETLILMFDVSIFLRHNFARVWSLASSKLISLEIGYISSVMVTELLSPAVDLINHQIIPGHPYCQIYKNYAFLWTILLTPW
ncbi:UNVERIFIED_CONTAM: F-box/LRR-repeat protein 10 [Sesamum angustifolium]|uniref:F-box/LRR-repeat protein 10 n=1 Tax=Sesamum angustifolium TaxID=2727405 RepID=A0AAW2QCZ0_9LAMI